MFQKSDNDEFSVLVSIESDISELELFQFLGTLIGKALLENLTVNFCFNRIIYSLILEKNIGIDDLIFIDKTVSSELITYKL